MEEKANTGKAHFDFAFVVNSYLDFKSTPILFIQIAKPGLLYSSQNLPTRKRVMTLIKYC